MRQAIVILIISLIAICMSDPSGKDYTVGQAGTIGLLDFDEIEVYCDEGDTPIALLGSADSGSPDVVWTGGTYTGSSANCLFRNDLSTNQNVLCTVTCQPI